MRDWRKEELVSTPASRIMVPRPMMSSRDKLRSCCERMRDSM